LRFDEPDCTAHIEINLLFVSLLSTSVIELEVEIF